MTHSADSLLSEAAMRHLIDLCAYVQGLVNIAFDAEPESAKQKNVVSKTDEVTDKRGD